MQRELPLIGSATRPLHSHPASEVALCKTLSQAAYIALRHAGITQEDAADRLAVTGGYMSMLMTGKRKWNEDKIRRLVTITGSLAPLQWLAAQAGVSLYVDPVETRKAQLMAELALLQEAA